jgi:hypothetical protein
VPEAGAPLHGRHQSDAFDIRGQADLLNENGYVVSVSNQPLKQTLVNGQVLRSGILDDANRFRFHRMNRFHTISADG